MLLLKYHACATIINGTAQIPKDVTQNEEIRSMLEGTATLLHLLPIGVISPHSFKAILHNFWK